MGCARGRAPDARPARRGQWLLTGSPWFPPHPATSGIPAEFFLDQLLRNGTTTAAVFATSHPASVDALVDHTVGRVLDLIGVEQALSPAWRGVRLSTVSPVSGLTLMTETLTVALSLGNGPFSM